jgi:ATP-dependent Clp protease ATP-binding subunit ClpA
MQSIKDSLKQKNTKINFHPLVKDLILNKLKDEKLNARNIKDLVRSDIQVPISKFMINNSKIRKISVKIIDNKVNIS